jgi:uncharacterized protein YjdB
MKNPKLLLTWLAVLSLISYSAVAQKIYTPNTSRSMSSGGTYCQGAIASLISFKYNTCFSGTGTRTGTPITVTWYQNTVNATSGGTAVSSSSTTTNKRSTGTVSYRPLTTSAGTVYYYCVITWTDTTACNASLSLTSASAAKVVVKASPVAISGSTMVCSGSTITLSDASAGGTWTSVNTAKATIGASTGVVTGIATGTTTISYATGCGTAATTVVTVNATPGAITGTAKACVGSTSTLADATTGGTWSSSNTAKATVDMLTGVVTGVSSGTCIISYITGCGISATSTFMINAVPAAISGSSTVCSGGVTLLSDATGGGTWSSSNTLKAAVNSAGLVTGIAAGTANISYTNSLGCASIKSMTVNTTPGAINGLSSVCSGQTITLTDAVSGGAWSSSNTAKATVDAVTGVVTGVASGTCMMTYSTGCGTAATKSITVNQSPQPITGTIAICAGNTSALADATAGGTWNSANTAIATINSSTGLMGGVAHGTAIISYFDGVCSATATTTVNTTPAAITGTASACIGTTSALANTVTMGAWSSSNTSVATVDPVTGVVTAVTAGTTTITYSTGCGTAATKIFSVNATPASITGTTSVCVAATTVLANSVGGGTWRSVNTAVAAVSSGGVVTGVSADTVTIVYSIGGCTTVTTVTVNPLADAGTITGPTSMCEGNIITLGDAADDGTGSWSSSDASIADVDPYGTVLGMAGGTATISFTMTNGCGPVSATYVVTVTGIPNVDTITQGDTTICPGAIITLANTVAGGVWSSTNTSVATINSSTGVLTGSAVGTATISYVLTNSCGSDNDEIVVTVQSAPSAGSITGTQTVCPGSTQTFTDATAGGAWSISNTSVATVSGGIVTGVAAGTALISYSVTNGCSTTAATRSITVNPSPNAGTITGTASACSGGTTTLADAVSGGAWSSSNTAKATVTAGGVVTGVAAGSATISYSFTNSCGTAYTTTVVTIVTSPASGSITGTTTVCQGATTALTDAAAGGVWSSSNNSIATAGTGGVVTGVAGGSATISYTVTNACGSSSATAVVTVNPLPNAGSISGTATVCAGSATNLTDAVSGGVWTSANTAIATVTAGGVVTGVSAGTSAISYTTTNGCGSTSATAVVTVNPLPNAGSISGATSLCTGATITLSDASAGGVWASSNSSIATAGTSTGVITGVAIGTATISYSVTNSCGTAVATSAVTVNNGSGAGSITGTTTVCAGATTNLTDATGAGVWSSSDNTIATVGAASGIVTGIAAGNAVITYSITNSCGTYVATAGVTVNPLPAAGSITGTASVCAGATTSLTDAAAGGAWSSSNSAICTVTSTGVVTGIAAGNATISYSVTNGCGTATATGAVTVNPLPNAGSVSGTATVCAGSTTALTDAATGGAWSSGNTSIATVTSSGVVTGVAAGNTTISYIVTNGCGTASATAAVTVNPMPNAGSLSGTTTICQATTSTLTDAVSGGVWSSNDNTIATVTSAGVVTGVAAGGANISYSVTNSCGTDNAVAAVTIIALPNAGSITGTTTVCAGGATTSLNDASAGGVWSSSNISAATVDASGTVTGVTQGTTTISYVVTSSCGTAGTAVTVIVNPLPNAGSISGTSTVCPGATTSLSDAVSGGAWSSSDNTIATAGTSGTVTGVAAGTVQITYSVSNSCGIDDAVATVTVNPLPNAGSITGGTAVCAGATITLADAASGGVWSSSATSVATVSAGGIVSGVAGGNATISYSVTNGCGTASATSAVTVDPLPGAGTITGTPVVCEDATITLADTTGTGTWTSSDYSIADVDGFGGVTGMAAGTASISYAVTNGCGTTTAVITVTVNPLPDAGTISGTTTVCQGATVSLTDPNSGGVWSSGNTSVSTVTSSGVVSGVSAGTSIISYVMTNGCGTDFDAVIVTVNPLPNAGSITGTGAVCPGATTALTDAAAGGAWSSSDNTIATVTSSGVVTGVAVGSATISYVATNSCGTANATIAVTVNPLPNAGSITGGTSVTAGSTITLSDVISGGAWSSSDNTIATVTSAGVVTGVAGGVATISYAVTNSCGTAYATAAVTVNALPNAGTITGAATVCAGATTSLTDAATGGVWSSSNTSIATVTSSGVVTGVAAGSSIISYTVTNAYGSAYATAVVTVNPAPNAGTVTGVTPICPGATATFTDAAGGGVWSSSNTSVASVGSAGIVTGVTAGNTIISYAVTNGCGTAYATAAVTVSPLPNAGSITGTTSVCAGSTIAMTDATAGGAWSSSYNTIATVTSSGVVTGVGQGTASISYTVTTGCGAASATSVVTVNPLPNAGTISGVTTICLGSSSTLTDPVTGGIWTSVDYTVASIGSSSGVVTGMSVGTTTISYTVTNTCGTASAATTLITVLSTAPAITGNTQTCVGSVTTLHNTGAGVWTSSNTSVATVGSSTGIVTGVSTGTANITYTLACGYATATVSVIGAPAAITGATSVCVGASTSLTNPSAGGTWSSNAIGIAVVGSSSGVVSGVSAGNTGITYTTSIGCTVGKSITVNPIPASINGITVSCAGTSATLTDATAGGVWSSSNTSIATVVSGTGVVYAVSAGTANITYTIGTGCYNTTRETVILTPLPITGPANVCLGYQIGLNDAGSGTWTSSNPSVASVGFTNGIVSGLALGTVTITYTMPCGIATKVINVTPAVPGPTTVTSVTPYVGEPTSVVTIIGTNFNTTPINNIVYFGATQATVAAATGTSIVVSVPTSATFMPISVENVTCALIGYSQQPFLPTYNNSAYVSGTVNFDSRVDYTAGTNPTNVVVGDIDGDGKPEMIVTNVSDNTISVFQNTSTGGAINSGSFASKVDFATGAYPLSAAIGDIDGDGRLDIVVANEVSNTLSVLRNTSTIGSVSFAPKVDFATGVNPISISVGDFDQDGKTDLAVANFYSGTVSVFRNTSASGSVNTGSFAAKVDFATGSHPYSLAISDLDGDGLPDLAIANQGDGTVSVLRNSSTTGIINSGSFAPKVDFTVGSQPLSLAIGDIDGDGKLDLAVTNSINRSVSILRNTATSGAITSASFAAKVDFASGIMPYKIAIGDIDGDGKPDMVVANYGNTRAGTTTVSVFRNTATSGSITTGSIAAKVDYLMGNAPRCVAIGDLDGDGKPDLAVTTVNDNTISVLRNNPLSSISGSTSICGAGSTTTLSDVISGGAWSSNNTAIATVDAVSGVVTGVAYGTATISYTVAGGITTATVTVNAGTAPVSGSGTVCLGASVTLSDATSGGTWSSSNPAVAIVGSATGTVTGLASGSVTISYSVSSGCPATAIITVNPPAITGLTGVCTGVVTTLSNASTGGTWSSSNTAVASVDATSGDVTGVSTGNATITYTTSAGCAATTTVNVYSAPSAIGGTSSVCAGATTALTNFDPGGTWSSQSSAIASVGYTGIVTGVSAGTTNITYSMGTSGCSVNAVVTVNPLPSSITGTVNVCPGTTTTLSDATTGGVWSSTDPTLAVIGSSSGIVTGIASGAVAMSYTLSTGCSASITVNVYPLPLPVSGSTTVCAGSTVTLSDFGSGTWSTTAATATVGSATGVVTGVSNGTAAITYTLPSGCSATAVVTVNPLPSAISGLSNVCAGSSVTLSDAGAGTWSSSDLSVAAIGTGTGVVTGNTAGTATISYALPTGCIATAGITVSPLPAPISGSTNFCVGTTTTLSDTPAGGTWASSNTAVATVGATNGIVNGVSAGTSVITYTSGAGCAITTTITANALPAPICGSTAFCAGLLRNLSDATSGGTWSSSNTSVATINAATGAVMGITGGTTTITYSLPCGTVTTVITVYAPPPGPPTITSMSASMAMPTATVNISGANFNGLPTDNIVYFGATRANVLTASPTALTVTVPSGATYMPVSVDIVGCALTGYSQYPFMPVYNNSSYVAGTVNFDAHLNFTTGTNPYSVAVGDLDGDGKADIAVANVGSNTISVFRNTATTGILTTGSFAAKVDFATGSSPYIVALGDLDGDGKLDMVVTNEVSNTISILRNTAASGTISSSSFAAKVDLATGVNPISVAIGDIDKDGKADLAVANFYSNSVSVYRNIGNVGSITTSSFAAKVDYTTGNHPYCVALGDIDGDAKLDMVIANQASSTISLYRNTATSGSITTGSFASKVDFTTGANPYHVAVGDLDGDGKADVAVVNNTANTVSVFRNTATSGSITSSSLSSKIDFTTGTSPYSVAIGDIDGDGKADLVIANSGVSSITVLRNMTASAAALSSTSFTCRKDFATCVSPRFVAIGDLDGDGKPDLAASCLSSNHLCVLRNDPMSPVSGVANVCGGGATATFSDATPGGTWSSSNTSVATVCASTGVVTGLATGTAAISYTLAGGSVTTTVNVYAVPKTITGASLICAGATTTLTDSVSGGTWFSYNTTVASIGSSSGVVTGVSAGTTTISYTNVAGCFVTRTVGVNPLPVAGSISGSSSVAVGSTIALSASAAGGTWSSSSTAIATVGLATGVVTGVSVNTAVITYSVVNSCGTASATASVTVVASGHRQAEDPAGNAAMVSDVRVLPNPSNGEFSVRGNLGTADDEEVTFEVTNMLGQVVYNSRQMIRNGKLDEHISLNNNMVNGMYTLTMRSVTDNKIFHLVIER